MSAFKPKMENFRRGGGKGYGTNPFDDYVPRGRVDTKPPKKIAPANDDAAELVTKTRKIESTPLPSPANEAPAPASTSTHSSSSSGRSYSGSSRSSSGSSESVAPITKPSEVDTTALAASAVGGAAAAGALASQTPNPFMQATDTVVNTLGSVSGIVGMGMLVPLAGNLIGGATKFAGKGVGIKTVEKAGGGILHSMERMSSITNAELAGHLSPAWGKKLAASNKMLGDQKIGNVGALHTISHAAWITGSAVGLYGVARSVSEKLDTLGKLNKDLTGKDLGTAELLFGSVPKPVAEARKKLMMSEGAHGFAHAAGLFLNVKFMKNPNFISSAVIGMGAQMAPDMVAGAVDDYVGHSVLEIYGGMSNAFKQSGALPAEAYGELLMAAGDEFKSHGKMGERVLAKIAGQLEAERKSPAEVLNELHNGGMKARMDAIMSAQSRIGKNNDMQKPVLGAHTQRMMDKAALAQMTTPSQLKH